MSYARFYRGFANNLPEADKQDMDGLYFVRSPRCFWLGLVDDCEKSITVSTTQLETVSFTNAGGVEYSGDSFTPAPITGDINKLVGAKITIIAANHLECYATVDHIEGSKIYYTGNLGISGLSAFPKPEVFKTTTNSLRLPEFPEYGTDDYLDPYYQLSVGSHNIPSGYNSFATGYGNVNVGDYSYTAGIYNYAGYGCLAEGSYNFAIGDQCHAEGWKTCAGIDVDDRYTEQEQLSALVDCANKRAANPSYNSCAHSEGMRTKALAVASHAEGYSTKATAEYSHASNYMTKATGKSSTAINIGSTSSGEGSFASGYYSTASGKYASSFGYGSIASGESAAAFGTAQTTASGKASFAAGENCSATATRSFAAGYKAVASASASVAMGYDCQSNGQYSFSGGLYSRANGYNSVAFCRATVTGEDSVGFGGNTSGGHSITAGYGNNNAGWYSSAFGYLNNIYTESDNSFVAGSSNNIHATGACLGWSNRIRTENSITIGSNLAINAEGKVPCIAVGQYNRSVNGDDTIFVVGCGYAAYTDSDGMEYPESRRNAIRVDKDGAVHLDQIKTENNNYITIGDLLGTQTILQVNPSSKVAVMAAGQNSIVRVKSTQVEITSSLQTTNLTITKSEWEEANFSESSKQINWNYSYGPGMYYFEIVMPDRGFRSGFYGQIHDSTYHVFFFTSLVRHRQ